MWSTHHMFCLSFFFYALYDLQLEKQRLIESSKVLKKVCIGPNIKLVLKKNLILDTLRSLLWNSEEGGILGKYGLWERCAVGSLGSLYVHTVKNLIIQVMFISRFLWLFWVCISPSSIYIVVCFWYSCMIFWYKKDKRIRTLVIECRIDNLRCSINRRRCIASQGHKRPILES